MSRGKPQVPRKSTHNRRPRSRDRVVDLLLLVLLVGTGVAAGWLAGSSSSDDMVVVNANFQGEVLPGNGGTLPSLDPDGGNPESSEMSTARAGYDAEQIGQLKAEVLRLRVLFQRLAEVAEIEHEGEFDLDFEIDAKTGDGEPLSRLDPHAPDALPVLFARLDPMIREVDSLRSIYLDRRRAFDRRLSGRPLATGKMSSGFGYRVDPLTGRRAMHHGLDFVADVGEPILAIADGVVTWSGPNGGYGLLVELEHAGDFSTRYAHNDTTLVQAGDRVRKGEIIATLGSSGRSTGPHLHLEVRHRGTATDPRYFIR